MRWLPISCHKSVTMATCVLNPLCHDCHPNQLIRPGGIIAVDNAVWSGRILCEDIQDDDTNTIRKLNDLVAQDERVDSFLLDMADGVLLAIKK